ncbi:unnamed protein product [Rhizophagus irregularis]|nr:unnamed protein product [Rhizophagus irregularis]
MVKKNKKTLHKFPSFQPAVSLDLDRDDAQAKASYYREKAKVRNTEKSTKNWITKFEEFRVYANYSVPLSELDDVSLLQQQLVEYISTMKRNDGSETFLDGIPREFPERKLSLRDSELNTL